MTEQVPMKAPIAQRVRAQLERDTRSVETILAAASRKGNTCTRWEAEEEHYTASRHFELGCWLHYFADRVGETKNFKDRVDCVRKLWEAGIVSPNYEFFTVFGFGERHFDTCFEMGDGDKVAEALQVIARAEPEGPIAKGVKAMGWETPATPVSTGDVADSEDEDSHEMGGMKP